MRINQISVEQREKEGEVIRSRLEQLGISQDDLADEIGVTQGTISKWLKGSKPINPKRLLWLAGRLDFDAIELRPDLLESLGVSGEIHDKDAQLAKKMARFLTLATPADQRKLASVIDAFLSELSHRQDKD